MGRRPGLIVLIVVGLGLAAVAIFVGIVGRPGQQQVPAERPEELEAQAADEESEAPEAQVSGAEVTVSDAQGEVVWRASFGGEITYDQDSRIARAEDVHWRFEGPGFERLSLKAPVMVAGWEEKVLRFAEGVAIEAHGGDLSFSAGAAEYQFGTRKLIGRGDVRFQRGSFSGRAEELVIDNRAEVIRLKRGELVRRW
ncbi:MAG: hypothetical protein U9R79_15290 [Armatimonadota bacterium]|nr:hypothetical protein [Armatimonadota bacterium]